MKAKLFKSGKEESIELPANFNTAIRRDILLKVFESEKRKQPHGTMFEAGAKYSAAGKLKHTRHVWKTTYGKGISRVPRKIMSRSGDQFNWIGATSPNTRGGRRAHPPKVEEIQDRKINKKENLMAYNSAFAGTASELYMERKYGLKINPVIVFDSSVLQMKTRVLFDLLEKHFGTDAMTRILQNKTQRAGKGKARGRRYKSNAGMVFIIGSDENMNRVGVDVVKVKELKIRDLAPNGLPGRFTGYTEKALAEINKIYGERK